MKTDWVGEYEKLNSFFAKAGIVHHVSCSHAHQQNGSAKRKHCHIVKVGLAILSHASMPLKFLDGAFQAAATYLINRLPSKTIQHSAPIERLFHKKKTPDYLWLTVFGCVCWPHLYPYNTQKLQFRSKQRVVLGL
jgi:histone deacetylase 1/2